MINLLLVQKLHQIVVAEVCFLVVVQINQESFDDFVDGDLRDFFRLNFAHEVCENPVHGLKPIDKRYRVHHFNFSRVVLLSLHRVYSRFHRLQSLLHLLIVLDQIVVTLDIKFVGIAALVGRQRLRVELLLVSS